MGHELQNAGCNSTPELQASEDGTGGKLGLVLVERGWSSSCLLAIDGPELGKHEGVEQRAHVQHRCLGTETRPKQKRPVRWLQNRLTKTELGHKKGVCKCQTFDCSGKPIRMTIRWSAMWEPASSGMGIQEVEPWWRAQCVREPRSSQDSWRMWETHSMNSFGLRIEKRRRCSF